MLLAKIFINDRQIDEVHVHNTCRHVSGDAVHGVYEYEIVRPALEEPLPRIQHRRSDGYEVLLARVFEILAKLRAGSE